MAMLAPPSRAFAQHFYFQQEEKEKLEYTHCWPKLLSLGRIHFIFRKLGEGIWINDVFFELEGSVSSSLYVKHLSFSAACKRYAKNEERQCEWELFWSDKLAPDYYHSITNTPHLVLFLVVGLLRWMQELLFQRQVNARCFSSRGVFFFSGCFVLIMFHKNLIKYSWATA